MKKTIIISFLLLIFSCLNAQTNADSILNSIRKIENIKQQLSEFEYYIGNNLRQNPDIAKELSLEMKKKADSFKFAEQSAKALYFLSIVEMQTGNYALSIDYSNKSINIRDSIKIVLPDDSLNLAGLASNYNILGITYDMQGIYEKSLENYYKSLDIRKQVADDRGIANCYTNIGLIYAKKADFDKAVEYFYKAKDLYSVMNDKRGMAVTYNNLGLVYKNKKNNEKALEYFLESIKIKEKIDDQRGIASTLNNTGQIYDEQGKDELALKDFNKSLEIAQEINDIYTIGSVNNSLSRFYFDRKEYNRALTVSLEALEIFQNMNSIEKIATTTEQLSLIYKELNNFQKAYQYHVLYKQMSDSIVNEKKTKELTTLQLKYEFEQQKKLEEIEQKKKEQATQAELENNRIVRNSLIAGVLLMILLVLVVLRSYLIKRKDNNKLELQKNEILKKNEELRQQKEEIQKQSTELEKLSVIASKTDNAIMVLDKNGKLEWVNEGFTRLFEVSFEFALKKFGNKTLLEKAKSEITKKIDECISGKKTVIFKSNFIKTNREIVWVQSTLTPITDANGEVEKIIIIESDISKIIEAENEIKQQHEEILSQKDELEAKNSQIQIQNEYIRGSIRYAKTIQEAILPTKPDFSNYFNHFIIYRPKDIVSGDFYWLSKINTSNGFSLVFALADCTGHGVPGGFMSLIGNSLLGEIINAKRVKEPAKVLDLLHTLIIKALKQDKSDNNDGMDISLCFFNFNENNECYELIFSGAKSDIYHYKNGAGKLQRIRGVRKTVGGIMTNLNKLVYENNTIEVQPNDKFYFFTDGIVDQNDVNRRRFGTKRLIRIIEGNINKSMLEQKQIIVQHLNEWQESEPQRDDITAIGLQLKDLSKKS